MAELEKEAHDLAGGPFNLGSPKQLQQILFEEQGLPIIRKTISELIEQSPLYATD